MNHSFEKAENKETRERLPYPVYHIESPDDDSVLVGVNVEVIKERNNDVYVTWFDTSHRRMMRASAIQQKDDYFAFERDKDDDGGGNYFFEPMKLSVYDKIKDRFANVPYPESETELIEMFQQTLNDEI